MNALRTDLTVYHNLNSCGKKSLDNCFPKLIQDKVVQDRKNERKRFHSDFFFIYLYCGLYKYDSVKFCMSID